MCGKGMVIGNEEKTLVFFLHPDKTFQRPEIISQVKVARWPNSAYNYQVCKVCKVCKVVQSIFFFIPAFSIPAF